MDGEWVSKRWSLCCPRLKGHSRLAPHDDNSRQFVTTPPAFVVTRHHGYVKRECVRRGLSHERSGTCMSLRDWHRLCCVYPAGALRRRLHNPTTFRGIFNEVCAKG